MAQDNIIDYLNQFTLNEILVIIAVLLIVAYFIVNRLREARRRYYEQQQEQQQQPHCSSDSDDPKCKNHNALAKEVTTQAPDFIGYPKPAGKGVRELEPEPEMIAMYYKDEVRDVPVQYERRPIGSCPVSKPMSTDLPIANIPMCMLQNNSYDMHLRKQ